MKHSEEITDRAVGAVLACPRLEDAAHELGVSRTTLWRMTQSEEFKERLREARTRLNEEVLRALQANTLEAVHTLRSIMLDVAAPAAARVTASAKIAELGMKARKQLDTDERLAALEFALKQRTKNQRVEAQLKKGAGK